jgi:hypothetical protein
MVPAVGAVDRNTGKLRFLCNEKCTPARFEFPTFQKQQQNEALFCIYTTRIMMKIQINATRCYTCNMAAVKMKPAGETGALILSWTT